MAVNQFQPSGVDYIIHVLGDDAREKYLNSFLDGNCKYAATIREEYTTWEYWIRSANWFFYRELYQRYYPISTNSYQMIWRKNGGDRAPEENIDIEIEVEQIDCSTVRIKLFGDKSLNGFADVKVTYHSERSGSLRSRFIFQNMVSVGSSSALWNIRPEGAEYLPIEIINGSGEIILTSQPKTDTMLSVSRAECQAIYTVPFDYLEIQADAFDDNGICKLHVPRSEKNRRILNDVVYIKLGGQEILIDRITETDSDIWLELDCSTGQINEVLQKNNVCEVVRNGDNGKFQPAYLTDFNWADGISNDGSTILFRFSDRLLQTLEQNSSINCASDGKEIVGFDYDENWIRAEVEGGADIFKFPNVCWFD